MVEGQPTAYLCTNYVCKQPTNDAAILGKMLEG